MPTMITLVDGTVPVAADFNTNYTRLNQAIGTGTSISAWAAGELPYASAANTLARLSPGTTGQALTMAATGLPAWSSSILFTDQLTGLTLSNDAGDATNDIDIAAGGAASDDATIASRVFMTTAAIIKRTDANWAVGTNQGGLDTGSVGNGTYHVFLIQRVDTGVVDVLFSLSATAPTMPTNYTKQRRIGSIVRTGGAIKAFVQHGDWFDWTDPVLDVNNAASGTSANTATLTAPTGVVFVARLSAVHTSGTVALYLSALDQTDSAPSLTTAVFTGHNNAAGSDGGTTALIRTNTSAQIRYRASANGQVFVATHGWIDRRGRG